MANKHPESSCGAIFIGSFAFFKDIHENSIYLYLSYEFH